MREARGAAHRLAAEVSTAVARLALWKVDRLGARPRVHGRPFIENLGVITIGERFELDSIGARSHLVTGPGGLLAIGDGVSIGAGAAIAAEIAIEIGDGARLGPLVMLMDSDYHSADDRSSDGAVEAIRIGAGAWLGERVTVLKGAIIGRGARIGDGSVVSGVIPDGAFAAGVPARVVLRSHRAETPSLRERVEGVIGAAFARSADADAAIELPPMDSLGALRLVVSLEDEFRIALRAEALAPIRTLEELCELVGEYVASEGRRAGTDAWSADQG